MKKILFTALMLLGISAQLLAQENRRVPVDIEGSVSGSVFDKDSISSLPSVNVALYSRRDSALVKAGMTDANGKFKLPVKKTGAYYLELKFIGYKTKHIAPIFLSVDKPTVELKKLILSAKDNELNEVKVVAETPMIEHSIDKTTLNVTSNAVAQGGTALELLQLIPNVNVSTDGTVQLRGSDKVKILMDGRQSMFNSLDQVPSEMLDKIEVMTNPSSRYEADGTAGIINLITNKRKVKGYFIGANLNRNSRGMFGGGLNASAKLGKFSFMANYNARVSDVNGNTTDSLQYYSVTSGELLSATTQTRQSNRHSLNQNIRISTDYSFNDKTTLSLQAGLNFGSNSNKDTTDFSYFNQNRAARHRGTNTDANNWNGNFILAFNKKFDAQGHELNIEASLNNNHSESPNRIYDSNLQHFAQDVENSSFGQGYNLKIDYERMLTPNLKLELGEKSNLNRSRSDYNPADLISDAWIHNDTLRNNFEFNRDIHSAYLILTYPITNKLMAKVGSRYEYTHEFGTQLTDNSKIENSYGSVYPNFYLVYKLSNNQSLNFNYNRRFDRPNTSQLNPKTDRSNPMAIRVGNTSLKPEDINAVELKYNFNTKPFELNSAIYYRYAQDGITRSITYNGPISITSYKNQQTGKYYGGDLNIQFKPYEWLRLGASGNWNRSEMSADTLDKNADTEMTTWMAKFNATFNKPNICNFQITGNYFGPRQRHTGSSKAIYSVDLAVRRNFFNRKLSVFMRVSDVFNTRKTDDLQTGFIGNDVRYIDAVTGRETSRIVTFGLNFNFSNMQRNKKDGPGGERGRGGDGPGGGPGGPGGFGGGGRD